MLCLSGFELYSRWVPLKNNNFARASRFLVYFFAVTARLRRENP